MTPPSCAETSPTYGNLEGLWLQHKDVIHHLYITENKTLSPVKHAMESGHKFPMLRLHDYEVALRELLKMRKNLKKEDWCSIELHMSNRKRQGKESEVLWNNIPLATRKVRKDILRNRRLNQVCHRSRTTELPMGLIIRTPPGSPPGQLSLARPPSRLFLDPEQALPTSSHGVSSFDQASLSSWDVKTAYPEPAHIGTSQFRQLPNAYPLLVDVPAAWTWIPGPRLFGGNPSLDVLARVTFTLSNKLEMDWTCEDHSWFLHWLGVSADFTMLRTFFSIKTPTVCAAYENLCNVTFRLRRSAVARVLFEIHDTMRKNNPLSGDGVDFLQIAAHIGSRKDGMLDIAKRMIKPLGSSYERSHGTGGQCVPRLFLSAAARRDIPMMEILAGALGDCHEETHFRGDDGIQRVSLVMHQVYAWNPEETKDGYTLAEYVQLLVQGGLLSTSLSARCCYYGRPKVAVCNPESFTIDELVMICPPMKRKNLHSVLLHWSIEHRAFINKAGVFTAALGGPQSLLGYLRTRKQNDALEIRTTMQECLLFAASLNDTQTISALLELGVDPAIGLLSNNSERYHKGDASWNPMLVAAAAGNLETLNLLKETMDVIPFLKSAPVYEIIQVEDPQTKYRDTTGREILRMENLRRHLLYSQKMNSDAAVANGTADVATSDDMGSPRISDLPSWMTGSQFFITEKRRVETITWIRKMAASRGMGNGIDKNILEAALCNDPDTFVLACRAGAYHPCDVLLLDGLVDANLDHHEGDMDLLQLSIRAQCSWKVVEFLLSKGFRVHSRAAAGSGNTMLHDALLSRSRDRSKIVHHLLQEGADYKHVGDGLTILEASLHRDFWWASGPFPDYIDIFSHLLAAGAPVRSKARPQIKGGHPLICQLVRAGADDDLILRYADAGADLNERGRAYGFTTANMNSLELVIRKNRERLATELIRRGADVHAPASGDGGSTALQAACLANSSFQFIEYLVRVQGANVNEAPSKKYGKTALQLAAFNGSLCLAEFLLDNGADVNALSGKWEEDWHTGRRRALDFAVTSGRLDMVEFLLKAGGRSGTGGLGGAIHMAKRFRRFAVLVVLLDWEERYGRIIMEEEADWQRQYPHAARLLSEP